MSDEPAPYVPQSPASYGRPAGGLRARLYDVGLLVPGSFCKDCGARLDQ